MITPEEYQKLRENLDALRRGREQAKGALKEQERRLAEEFNLRGEEAAKKKLKEIDQELAGAEAEYRKLEAEYDKEFGGTA